MFGFIVAIACSSLFNAIKEGGLHATCLSQCRTTCAGMLQDACNGQSAA